MSTELVVAVVAGLVVVVATFAWGALGLPFCERIFRLWLWIWTAALPTDDRIRTRQEQLYQLACEIDDMRDAQHSAGERAVRVLTRTLAGIPSDAMSAFEGIVTRALSVLRAQKPGEAFEDRVTDPRPVELPLTIPPHFAHASEAELARILDYYGVNWQYEPRRFPMQWTAEGRVVESFTPDFYLPDLDVYVELTTLKQSLVRRKNRKLRRMREVYPGRRIKLFYGKDFRALMLKYGRFDFAASLNGLERQLMPRQPGEREEASVGRGNERDHATLTTDPGAIARAPEPKREGKRARRNVDDDQPGRQNNGESLNA